MQRKLTGDEYIELLLHRQNKWVEANRPAHEKWAELNPETVPRRQFLVPLLEWFIEDGDEEIVNLPDEAPRPVKVRTPRTYLPASHWRAEKERVQAQMQALAVPVFPEVAAARGQALGTVRTRKAAARQDRNLEKYAALQKKLSALEGKLRSAEYREAKAARML